MTMGIARTRDAQADAFCTNSNAIGARFVLHSIAALAGTASVYTGLTYGLDRAGILGSAVGAACALGCLLGPRLLIEAVKARDVTRSIAAAVMLAIAAPVAVSAALGAAATSRETAARTEAKAAGDQNRAQASYDRATADLAQLPSTRPVTTLEAELAAILKDGRLKDCRGWLANYRLRQTCISKVEPLRLELANAKERSRLAGALEASTLQLSQLQQPKPASMDAAALSRLMGRLGIGATADQVSDALLVLLVAATELLGGAALALAGPIGSTRSTGKADLPADGGTETESDSPRAQVIVSTPESAESQAIAQRLADGPLVGRQRDLAKMFDLPITTFRRRIETMPNVRMVATPTGSRLELVSIAR